jgi:hypothetical protein
MAFNVSAILNLHREGTICIPAIRSFLDCCNCAGRRGVAVERIAVLDRPDSLTRRCFDVFSTEFHTVQITDVGDLGSARNVGTACSTADFVAFFDGDDLWGSQWLADAFHAGNSVSTPSVFHPEIVYFFHTSDFEHHSLGEEQAPGSKSLYFIHEDSSRPEFNMDALYFNNVWTSNSFGPASIYRDHPFIAADHSTGFGIEDWSWNHKLLRDGVTHRIVPNTVHLVRVKSTGSLGQQNRANGLLPDFLGYSSVGARTSGDAS